MAEPWIRVHANLVAKPVVMRAAEALRVSQHEAMGLLVEFWGAVSQHATNGCVGAQSDAQLEVWAGWRRKRGLFAAFVRASHLDADGRVNEWDEYAGALEDRRTYERDRKRTLREKLRGRRDSVPDTEPGSVPVNVPDNSGDIPGTSTPTIRNDTKREESTSPTADAISARTWKPGIETALADRLPADPDRSALGVVLFKAPNRLAWAAELTAMLDGMAGHIHATPAQIAEALSEFVANGGAEEKPSLSHFKAYVERVVNRPIRPALSGNGKPVTANNTDAMRALVKIRELITTSQQPGQAAQRFIRATDVKALGPRTYAAYQAVGGASSVIAAEGEKYSYLLRDFTRAYEAAHAAA